MTSSSSSSSGDGGVGGRTAGATVLDEGLVLTAGAAGAMVAGAAYGAAAFVTPATERPPRLASCKLLNFTVSQWVSAQSATHKRAHLALPPPLRSLRHLQRTAVCDPLRRWLCFLFSWVLRMMLGSWWSPCGQQQHQRGSEYMNAQLAFLLWSEEGGRTPRPLGLKGPSSPVISLCPKTTHKKRTSAYLGTISSKGFHSTSTDSTRMLSIGLSPCTSTSPMRSTL